MLSDAYLAHARVGDAPSEALEAALARLVDSAYGAEGDAERRTSFVAHLARLHPNASELVAASRALQADDMRLAFEALDGDPVAITTLLEQRLREIPVWVRRLDPNPAFAEDVRQEVSSLLFAPTEGHPSKLAQYTGRGSLGGFLRTLAVRTASNSKRRTKRDVIEPEPSSDRRPSAERAQDDALARLRHGSAFATMIRRAVAALSADERALLKLHYLDGLSLEGVAESRRVSRATAARHLAAARARAFTIAREAWESEGGSASSLELPSQFDLTLRELFER